MDRLQPLEVGSYKDLILFVKDRAGHDRRYAIDATKIKEELKWKPEESFDTGIIFINFLVTYNFITYIKIKIEIL